MNTTTSSFIRFIKGTLLAILLLMPTMAHAERQAYAVVNSSTLTFYYDENRSTMLSKYAYVYDIPEQGGPEWLKWQRYIYTVVFDKTFADYHPKTCHSWFYEIKPLNTIKGIENLNTSEVTDMYGMFYNCRNIESIDLSHFNTDKVTDMAFMFNDCKKLASLDVSNFNTSNVTNMRNMFKGCALLSSLDTKNFDTKNVTNMCEMFNSCTALESVDLSSFNTENVTDMSYMFYGCNALTELGLSSFNTENVTNMNAMFSGCKSITSFNLSSFDTRNVTDMGGMFNGCSNLPSLDLSNFNTANVADMSGMFLNCSSLNSLNLTNFNTANVTDMNAMFLNCSALNSLNLTNFNTSNVTRMDYMLMNCTSLRTIDLSSFNTRNVTQTNNMFYMNQPLNITIITSDGFKLSDSCNATDMFVSTTSQNWYRYGKDKAVYTTEGGFFTKAPDEGWTEYDSETKTLTLHYNNARKATIATATYLFPEKGSQPGWREYASDIEKVEIDNQFIMYSVGSCAGLFSGLSNLKSIEGLKYMSTSAVSDMSAQRGLSVAA